MSKFIGVVNGWFSERDYGWVSAVHDNSRCFLHSAHIVSGEPAKGKLVRFDRVQNTKGYLCANAEVFTDRKELERSDAAALLASSRSVQIFDLLEKAVNHGSMMTGAGARQEAFQSDTLHSCA